MIAFAAQPVFRAVAADPHAESPETAFVGFTRLPAVGIER